MGGARGRRGDAATQDFSPRRPLAVTPFPSESFYDCQGLF